MGLFTESSNLTTMGIALLVVIAIVLVFNTIASFYAFAAIPGKKDSFLDTMASKYIAFAGRSDTGARDQFFGRPEAPVFYDIGDTDLVRSDRGRKDKFGDASAYASLRKAEMFGETDIAKAMLGH